MNNSPLTPSGGRDFDDVARLSGSGAVKRALDAAQRPRQPLPGFQLAKQLRAERVAAGRPLKASTAMPSDPFEQVSQEEFAADLASEARGLAFRKGVSARALMAKRFAPVRWIVPGYLVEGMTLFAGAPKLGKSWMALGWCIAVAGGGAAMGSIHCDEGDVLGLMLEDNERRLQRRMRQLALCDLPERLTLLTEWPTLDDGCIAEIEAWIEGVQNPRLIVVDVFARVRGAKGMKETDYDADYRQAAQLQGIASRNGLAVVIIHHTRKMAADDPFDEVSGTRGLTGAADSVLVLKRDAGTQQPILYGRGRDLEEVETAMQFDKGTGAWSVLSAAWQVADTVERREIQEVLGRSVDPMTPTEIAATLGKTRANVGKMLAKMYADGKVEKATTGRYTLVTPVTPVTHSPPDIVTSVTRVTDTHARADDDPDDPANFMLGPRENQSST